MFSINQVKLFSFGYFTARNIPEDSFNGHIPAQFVRGNTEKMNMIGQAWIIETGNKL